MTKQRMPQSTVQAVQERCKGRCERCGLPAPRGVYHHRQPRGIGGSSTGYEHLSTNILFLHDSEHRMVHANPERSYRDGLLVRHGTDPASVPVLTAHGEVWLGDGGFQAGRSPAATDEPPAP